MNLSNDRIIEVEVTAKDLEKMRADGVAEKDLPEIGIKRYRPARHICRNKSEQITEENAKSFFFLHLAKKMLTIKQT
jgi:hypothetical protein